MNQYKQDAAYELAGIDAKIASNRKSAGNVTKATSAAILDATLPSLARRRAELLIELDKLPERPARSTLATAAKLEFAKVFDVTDKGFDIPDFLQRRRVK